MHALVAPPAVYADMELCKRIYSLQNLSWYYNQTVAQCMLAWPPPRVRLGDNSLPAESHMEACTRASAPRSPLSQLRLTGCQPH